MVAVGASKSLPQWEGIRLVVTIVEDISECLEIIWKISLAVNAFLMAIWLYCGNIYVGIIVKTLFVTITKSIDK